MDPFDENAQFNIAMNPNIRMLNLPPGVPRQKQTRRRQPHRKAPSARSGKRKERGDAEESRGARENRAAMGDEKSEHSEKMERQAAAFDANRPGNVEEFVIWAPNKIEFRKLVTQTMQGLYQQQVNVVMTMMRQGHSCCLGGAHPDTTFENKKVRSVVVFTAGHNFVLQVPTLQCKMCKKQLTVHPYPVNCGPTSPTDACETWITDECLHLFRDLHTQNGLSAGGKLYSRPYFIFIFLVNRNNSFCSDPESMHTEQ